MTKRTTDGLTRNEGAGLASLCQATLEYLTANQDFTPGPYYGSIWSEKGYHGPLLDWHAGGSHHNRGAGSAGLAFWMIGKRRGDDALMRRAEAVFDWLAARQRPSGGYQEIQNNEKPSDWERTGLEECSTIPMGFVAHGLGHALLAGLPPKKLYWDCLQKACHWQLSIELPPGSGVFPHHERSPYDTLNANMHAAETLAVSHMALRNVYNHPVNIFLQGARRAVRHTLDLQRADGCFTYRANGGDTINYTSLVLWCLLNTWEAMGQGPLRDILAPALMVRRALDRGAAFLRKCVDARGGLLWEGNETSTAKHNVWTYAITVNALMRIGGARNVAAAKRLLRRLTAMRTASGLLPMRDEGEEITECAFMQADMLIFLAPFAGVL